MKFIEQQTKEKNPSSIFKDTTNSTWVTPMLPTRIFNPGNQIGPFWRKSDQFKEHQV